MLHVRVVWRVATHLHLWSGRVVESNSSELNVSIQLVRLHPILPARINLWNLEDRAEQVETNYILCGCRACYGHVTHGSHVTIQC